MPEYDPKSIPILDDIIDDDNSGAEQVNPVIAESESGLDEIDLNNDELDLFAAETADIDSTGISEINITTVEIDVETVEPDIADIDRFIDKTEDNSEVLATGYLDAEINQSAQIDYHVIDITDESGEAVINRQHKNLQYETVPLTETRQQEETAYTPAVDVDNAADINSDDEVAEPQQPFALEALVDDVVKQLMPGLEQQLRLLVMQALEEKLPAEIIAQFSADNDD